MKSTKNLRSQIAASLDLSEPLAPFAAQLMHGIDALGSYPAQTIALCKKLGFNGNTSVLDLACGRGSIAIELASLGCSVTAVDASPEFVQCAQFLARERGVKPRFITADVNSFASRKRFDVVVMLNLYPIEEAAEFCRGCVKPGGIMLMDDATLAPGMKNSRWLSRAEVKLNLEAEGDKVLAIRQVPVSAISRAAKKIESAVRENGKDLQEKHPALRREIAAYLKRLEHSRKLLTSTLRPTLFAVRVR